MPRVKSVGQLKRGSEWVVDEIRGGGGGVLGRTMGDQQMWQPSVDTWPAAAPCKQISMERFVHGRPRQRVVRLAVRRQPPMQLHMVCTRYHWQEVLEWGVVVLQVPHASTMSVNVRGG